jgi:hypothetical protein
MHFQGVRPRQYCQQRHVYNRDAGAKHPGAEIPTLELIPWGGTRVYEEEPEAKLWGWRQGTNPAC